MTPATTMLPMRSTPPPPRPRWRRRALALLVIVSAAAIAGTLAIRNLDPLRPPPGCEATVDGHTVRMDLDQAHHASLIAAAAVQRGLPARAVTIALAAAYQESDLHNLDHGDRDSLGLFQQRPSQGWGTPEQIMDPAYAVGAFYDALVKVPNYRDLAITVAAQEVQRSAFPDAYADHEQDARVLASALTGYSPGAFACTVELGDRATEAMGASGLTPRGEAALTELRTAFGELSVGGFDPDGVTTGHIEGSAHYDGRAVDVFFRPVTEEQRRAGWSLAQWAVANADRLGIATVIYDRQIWSAARSDEGWRPYEYPGGPTDDPTLMHEDHVHVDVI
jgi:hypothetical protein